MIARVSPDTDELLTEGLALMADLSMLKRLGPPPTLAEASTSNLQTPETAPLPCVPEDGRSMRRSRRTRQFATRVTADFDRRFRSTARRHGLLMTELLERSLEAFIREHAVP